MTPHDPIDAAAALFPHDAPTLSDVLDCVAAATDLPRTRRRDLASAVRRAAAALERRPDALPAHPPLLRRRLDRVVPSALGLTRKSWTNLISDLAAAFRAAGVTNRTAEAAPSARWATLLGAARRRDGPGIADGVGRFARFCSANAIEPEAVDEATVERFRVALEASELRKDPAATIRTVIRSWNKAVDDVDGWPARRLALPPRPGAYALDWTAFPGSLHEDVVAYLDGCSGDDLFAESGPPRGMNATTRAHREGQLGRFASALVHSGEPAETLVSIAAMTETPRLERGLRWMIGKRGGEPGPGVREMAVALRHAVRWHVLARGADDRAEASLLTLDRVVGRIKGGGGMSKKNRDRTRPFHGEAAVRRLVELPDALVRKAGTAASEKRAAILWETALAVGLLTFVALRRGELLSLRIDDFHSAGRGRAAGVRLELPGRLVKNGLDRFADLPPHLSCMLATFLEAHRPVLVAAESPFLFSRRGSAAPLDASSLYGRVRDAAAEHCGVPLSPHNFRHLVGVIHLTHRPGDVDAVRRILGHTQLRTTLEHYDHLSVDGASRAYGAVLESARRRR